MLVPGIDGASYGLHRPLLCLVDIHGVGSGNLGRMARQARVYEHHGAFQILPTAVIDVCRCHGNGSIAPEIDQVEAAVRDGDLVLASNYVSDHVLLDMNSVPGQLYRRQE